MKDNNSKVQSNCLNTLERAQMDEARALKLQKARERYGKPFAHEVRVKRTQPPSHILTYINQYQGDAADESGAGQRRVVVHQIKK